MENITILEFVKLLTDCLPPAKRETVKNLTDSELLLYGHKTFWLEDQDEHFSDSLLDKRTMARILHQFMKIELKIPDEPQIEPAKKLADLYTCRVCTNHVAQLYTKGIMHSEMVEINRQSAEIFNMTRLLSKNEVTNILQKIYLP